MGVHPVSPRDRHIVIGLRGTRCDRRRLRPGKAVLPPRRQLAVPMHEGGSARLIYKIDVKAFAGRERDAGVSIRSSEPEYPSWFAIDGEGPGAGGQTKSGRPGFGRGCSPLFRQEGGVPAIAIPVATMICRRVRSVGLSISLIAA